MMTVDEAGVHLSQGLALGLAVLLVVAAGSWLAVARDRARLRREADADRQAARIEEVRLRGHAEMLDLRFGEILLYADGTTR